MQQRRDLLVQGADAIGVPVHRSLLCSTLDFSRIAPLRGGSGEATVRAFALVDRSPKHNQLGRSHRSKPRSSHYPKTSLATTCRWLAGVGTGAFASAIW